MQTESRIQQDCVKWFRGEYCLTHHSPQLICFSVPNEGRDVVEQLKKKATGMLKGVSDLIIVLPGKVIFCEMKDDKGRQKPEQVKFENKVVALGHEYWLVRSEEEFQELIKNEIG